MESQELQRPNLTTQGKTCKDRSQFYQNTSHMRYKIHSRMACCKAANLCKSQDRSYQFIPLVYDPFLLRLITPMLEKKSNSSFFHSGVHLAACFNDHLQSMCDPQLVHSLHHPHFKLKIILTNKKKSNASENST